MVKQCHCANNSKVTNECLISSHRFLGTAGCMGGYSSKEASIKLNQCILRINIQNLGKHEVFLDYSHISVDDCAFCSKNPRLLQCNGQRGCTHDRSTPRYLELISEIAKKDCLRLQTQTNCGLQFTACFSSNFNTFGAICPPWFPRCDFHISVYKCVCK